MHRAVSDLLNDGFGSVAVRNLAPHVRSPEVSDKRRYAEQCTKNDESPTALSDNGA
jgi:hypothetical protein